MRKATLLAAAALTLAACGAKTHEYAAADGSVRAVVEEGTDHWTITDAEGREPIERYDSMRVVDVSEDGHPMTVIYYQGNTQHHIQYYSTMQKRGEGRLVDGKREGRWVFYHPNGNIQAESNFVAGREDGPYRVFRDNGAPYYIGQYANGIPVGTWEFYDQEGNLAGTKVYD